jgi:hypothetical protein
MAQIQDVLSLGVLDSNTIKTRIVQKTDLYGRGLFGKALSQKVSWLKTRAQLLNAVGLRTHRQLSIIAEEVATFFAGDT